MPLFFDSFWRAVTYCLRPRVIALSFLPLLVMVVLAWLLGYFFWEWAIDAVRVALEASSMIDRIYSWLTEIGFGNLKVALPPLIVVFAVTPLLVIVALIAVALCMTPGWCRWSPSADSPHSKRSMAARSSRVLRCLQARL